MVNFIVSIKNVQDFKLPLKRAGPFLSRTSADPEGNSILALYWGRHFWPCVPAFADLRVCAPTRVEGREDHHHQGQELQPGVWGGGAGGEGGGSLGSRSQPLFTLRVASETSRVALQGTGMHFCLPSAQALQGGVGELQALKSKAPTFSRPFSEADLRGGQITANFPSPLLAVGEGTLSHGCPSSC